MNASNNDSKIKDKLSNIYPVTIRLTNYGIEEFAIDDVIFNISKFQEIGIPKESCSVVGKLVPLG